MPSYKVIKSGHIVDIYVYDRFISLRDEEERQNKGGRDKEGKEERKAEYRATVAHRAYTKLMNIINANFDENSLFVTLTYKKNMQDIDQANYDLKKFLQKMKRRQADFKYVWVMEFQERGAIHYHMMCNLDIQFETVEERQSHERILADIWSHGFVDIGYKKTDNAGAYLVKYMTKDNMDQRLIGKKSYSTGGKLEKPKDIKGYEAIETMNQLSEYIPSYTSSYYSDFHGNITRYQFNLKRYNENTLSSFYENKAKMSLEKAIEIFGIENVEEVELDAY